MKSYKRLRVLAVWGLFGLGLLGCEAIARVDRNEIPEPTAGTGGSSSKDGGSDATAGKGGGSGGVAGMGGVAGKGGTSGGGGTGGKDGGAGTAGQAGGGSGGTEAGVGGTGGTSGNGGTSGTAGTAGTPNECKSPTDCPDPASECVARTCTNGKCGTEMVAIGTPTSSQTKGDCKVNQCDGKGSIEEVADDTDLPEDTNPCTNDTCSAGTPGHTNATKGTVCATDLVCDGNGHCTGCTAPAQCPGQDDECATRTCTTGVCGFNFTAAGTVLKSQVAGDCKVKQCDGKGLTQDAIDNTDLPNDLNECTKDTCVNGTPTQSPLSSGTTCTQNNGKFCDGAGKCVECVAASTCTGTDTDCQKRDCQNNACVMANVTAGTKLPTSKQIEGDCRIKQCDGKGAVENAIDNLDLPVDNNACTDDLCTAGSPTNPNLAAGTSCGTTLKCDGSGHCVGCVAVADCPGTDTECRLKTCVSGSCGWDYPIKGTVLTQQVAADCLRKECDGAGKIVEVNDDSDTKNDNNPCTADVCFLGTPENNPEDPGTPCTNENDGTVCNAVGQCVQCLQASTCAGTDTECQVRTCTDGACGLTKFPAGYVVTKQDPGDCHVRQCDSTGGVVSLIDDSDLPVDGNLCTKDLCTDGTPSHENETKGADCGYPKVCDGNGNCVSCQTDPECPAGTVCQTPKCNGGICSLDNLPLGPAPAGAQQAGDCQVVQCDGKGGFSSAEDNLDVPADDGNQCTGETCNAGQPSHPPSLPGAYCNQNGGDACDGIGNCVLRPAVVSTTPADGATPLASTSVAVTFSKAMNPATLTAQTVAGACSGSLQVSLNDFIGCVAFSAAAPVMTVGDTVATLTPAPGLLVNRNYKIRVTTSAQDTIGLGLGTEFTQATAFTTRSPNFCNGSVVISQLFGGGGSLAGFPNADYVELHNRGSTAVSLAGWAVQYASTAGTTWNSMAISGTIQPGAYFLIRVQAEQGTGVPLPTPDYSGTAINMSGTNGKVALTNATAALSGSCPTGAQIVDFVGYGTANCYEGAAAAPAASTSTALFRGQNGCWDDNNNNTNFTAAAPSPRNSTTVVDCGCVILNESGVSLEPDYCNVQSPLGPLTVAAGSSQTIYGQVYELGLTPTAGAPANVVAQLGLGPLNSNPQYESGWTWLNTTWNVQVGDNDEYWVTFNAPATGSYKYVYRYSLNNGISWTVCGNPGAGSNGGVDFELSSMQSMTTQ